MSGSDDSNRQADSASSPVCWRCNGWPPEAICPECGHGNPRTHPAPSPHTHPEFDAGYRSAVTEIIKRLRWWQSRNVSCGRAADYLEGTDLSSFQQAESE